MEIFLEQVPAGDHQAHWLVEYTIKTAQGPFRVIGDALESRHGRRVDDAHQVAPWMVTHAALVVNRDRKDEEGFSFHRRWKGRVFTKPVAEFEKRGWHAPAMTAERTSSTSDGKKECGWEIHLGSGESLIGASEGVTKARDFRRKAEN